MNRLNYFRVVFLTPSDKLLEIAEELSTQVPEYKESSTETQELLMLTYKQNFLLNVLGERAKWFIIPVACASFIISLLNR